MPPASSASGTGPDHPGFRYVENCWIGLADGVRLAATLWIPDGVRGARFDAIVEVLPYRKRDHTAARDYQNHGFLAREGFVGVRVDMRGCGDSEGVFDAAKTYDDIVEVIAWVRAQAWSSGSVGMMGLSWGGINAAMAAVRQPPGLEAVVACSFSADRYGVGMIWKNACMLNENFGWSTAVAGFCSRPPDPAVMGEGWRTAWLQRLEGLSPPVADYLGRQRRDDYWAEHRVADPSAIEVPLLMYAGWADSNYAQTLPVLMAGARGPRRAIFGPWGHKYPHLAIPGPGRDFLGEAADWFRRWLGKPPSGTAPDEAGYCAYVMQDMPARPAFGTVAGCWVEEAAWPPQGGAELALHLGAGSLSRRPGPGLTLAHRSPLVTGLAAGEVMPCFNAGVEPELPGDQREDDGRSLTFDTAPLEDDVESIGAPVLDLSFSVDRPVAFLAIRLCEVAPDGASARVNLGLHNLTRRTGEDAPTPLVPGQVYNLSLPLDFKAYRFRKGNRIRLAVSTSYWPMVWPSPQPVTLTVHTAESRLRLPLGGQAKPAQAPRPPRLGPSLARIEIEPPARERVVSHDLVAGETSVRIVESAGTYRLDDRDWTVSSRSEETHRIRDGDPLSARADIRWDWRFSRGEWTARTETVAGITCSETAFHTTLLIRAFEGGRQVFERRWDHEFARDLL